MTTLTFEDDEPTRRVIADAICRGQYTRPLAAQDEYSQRLWLTVADSVVNALAGSPDDRVWSPGNAGQGVTGHA